MSQTQPQRLQEEEESIDKDTLLDIEEDEEKATLNTTTSSIDYKKLFTIEKEPCISMHTGFRSLDYASLITLNILVVLWYDNSQFTKAEIFWAMFVFAYISNVDGAQKYLSALITFNIAQYLLYLWFCSWDELPLIVFSILLFIMLGIKLTAKLVYKYGLSDQAYLIHENIHEKEKEYKFYKPAKWYNGFELAMLATTVPMFYFNQS